MWSLNFLFLFSAVYAQSSSICSFSQGHIVSNWTSTSSGISIQFSNSNLGSNQWTAIVFGGDSKANSSMLVFENLNNQVVVQTKSKSASGVKTVDSPSQATVQSATLSGSSLNAQVTLPSTFDGVDLAACQTWLFIETGTMKNGYVGYKNNRPYVLGNVCAGQC